LLYIFVLCSFYCIFRIDCPLHCIVSFLAFRLQLLNKLELSLIAVPIRQQWASKG